MITSIFLFIIIVFLLFVASFFIVFVVRCIGDCEDWRVPVFSLFCSLCSLIGAIYLIFS